MRRSCALLFSLALLGGCAANNKPLQIPTYQPEAGANIVLSGDIVAAPAHGLTTGDLLLEPGFEIARHFHHGEEFLYVLGGSVTVTRPGLGDVTLKPGDALRIPAGTVHWGRAGPEGVRAISSWVTADGKPLRVPLSEGEGK